MLIISFDAVGDSEYERLLAYPAFSALSERSAAYRNIPSIFPTNTYPAHVSIATGALPREHGVYANMSPFPSRRASWNSSERNIRKTTLWQAAKRHGVDTAVVFWPVTAFSRSIRYNIPEVIAPQGKNQIITSLKAGSKLTQIKLVWRYGKLLAGIEQPSIDNFAAACMADILRNKNPGLALIHLTAYDSLCHKSGKNGELIETAYESLDRNLGALLDAAGPDRDIILFSDHSQIDVHTIADHNKMLCGSGLIEKTADGYAPGAHNCFFENCGGTAFFHRGSLPSGQADDIRKYIESGDDFRRLLTGDELTDAGWGGPDKGFGFCAKAGFCYGLYEPGSMKANHGYPLDMPDYTVFYMVRGCGLEPGVSSGTGGLRDITALAARSLGIKMD